MELVDQASHVLALLVRFVLAETAGHSVHEWQHRHREPIGGPAQHVATSIRQWSDYELQPAVAESAGGSERRAEPGESGVSCD
jgi:hypothetical protein